MSAVGTLHTLHCYLLKNDVAFNSYAHQRSVLQAKQCMSQMTSSSTCLVTMGMARCLGGSPWASSPHCHVALLFFLGRFRLLQHSNPGRVASTSLLEDVRQLRSKGLSESDTCDCYGFWHLCSLFHYHIVSCTVTAGRSVALLAAGISVAL